jgi:NAD(P)-dependent dehydrogenase (short-subunit alcohol dehydrogenase family)
VAGQFAVVTGTSSGIGLQVLESLLERDYFVIGGSRSETPFEHDNFVDVELDVRDSESVIDFFNKISEYTDSIHLFVNNAGITEFGAISALSEEDFTNQIETNLHSQFYLFKNLQDYLVEGETHILNILSTSSKNTYPHVSAYCAAEQGKYGFIQSVQKEWEDFHVRFSNLFVGAVDTPLWQGIDNPLDASKMLSMDDFMYVLDTVLDAPINIQFPELTFLHKDSYL